MTTNRSQHIRYNHSPAGRARLARYRATAKGLLNELRHEAKRRGT